jgi:amino acid transporter
MRRWASHQPRANQPGPEVFMFWKQLFAKKSLEMLKQEAEGDNRLRRVLGPIALTSLGVGAIIGSGIFVMTGRVAFQDAGPAIMLSFVVAGIGCLFAALCYAEFASMAPVAGSAYTYAYATLGEILAWIIGWDLILEYAMACACVAAGWAQYFNAFVEVIFGPQWKVPEFLCSDPFSQPGAWLNLPALLITLLVTVILVIGIRESAGTNALLVGIKVGVVLFVIAVGCVLVNPRNWTGQPVTNRVFPEDEIIPNLARKEVTEGSLEPEQADALIRKTAQDIQDAVSKAGSPEERTQAIEKRLRRFYADTARLPPDEATARIKKLTANLEAWARVERKKAEVADAVRAGTMTEAEAEEAVAEVTNLYAISAVEREKARLDAEVKAGKMSQRKADRLLELKKAEPFAEAYLPRNPEDEAVVQRLFEKVKEEAETRVTEKWGILGLVGLNRWLVPIDDSVRGPFAPYGLAGIIFGASIVFFAYIGFDSISTHAEEARRPKRDVPFGILASLVICTVLYIAMAAVLTGMLPYYRINPKAAVASAFALKGEESGSSLLLAASALISIGALAGLTSVLLITFLSQARIFLAMARDRLLPPAIFGAIHPRFRTPHLSTMLTGGIISVVAAFTPITKLEEMVNIGTLMAFVIVCASVLMLRIQSPNAERPFRTPLLFIVAPLGILVNLIMMLFLPPDTWMRLVVWLVIGLVIYLGYGRFQSTLGKAMRQGVPGFVPGTDGASAGSAHITTGSAGQPQQ